MALGKDAIYVWNRAATQAGGPQLCAGDFALQALLLVHGLIMNGGVLHASNATGREAWKAAELGFRFYGLEGVAAFLERVRDLPADARRGGEQKLDNEYTSLVPDDSFLMATFDCHYRAHPDQYAPVKWG